MASSHKHISKLLRSIPPKRAGRLAGASVDPTEARDAVGFGPDVRVVCGNGDRARRSSEV
jgi:hypothetical protein